MKMRLIILSIVIATCNMAFAQNNEVVNKQVVIEKLPEFPSGEEALLQYMKDNVKYPNKANKKGIEGRVIVSFVIGKEGNVTMPKIIKGIWYGCDEEALRVVATMPQWKPGMQRDKPVAVAYNLPVRFKLIDNKKRKRKNKDAGNYY